MIKHPFHNLLREWMLPLKEIDEAIPKKGIILELGCGEGVISQYLTKESSRSIIGIDLDATRLPQQPPKNLKFIHGDIIKYSLPKADAIVISDVLHHIDFEEQEKLLEKVYKLLNRKGVLIIKEINTEDKIRSKLSRFWDFVFYPFDKIYFSSSADLVKLLKKCGFKVSMKRASLYFPGSTNLYICEK